MFPPSLPTIQGIRHQADERAQSRMIAPHLTQATRCQRELRSHEGPVRGHEKRSTPGVRRYARTSAHAIMARNP